MRRKDLARMAAGSIMVLGLALQGGLPGVALAAGSGSGTAQPMAGGTIFMPSTMAPGKPVQFQMKIDAQTMAMIHADMQMHDNKMAQQKTMMCALRVLHQHRGMVELTCMPG
ncbi:MAG TPA: hypothetical protein PK677_01625 [Acidiphilium sp.]|nr:MAG: hypothetical protein B7Z57_14440 [Acidiphilium sp. 37-60-79]HQT87237.1 hypothetical protein [Acidiphilium sp.]